MPAKKLAAIGALLVSLTSCGGSVPHQQDYAIERAVGDWGISGLAVAVVKDGMVVNLRGYGSSDIDESTPIDGDTIFGIGSTTKAFGAALIATMVHEATLNWDDKVIDLLPDFQLGDPEVTRELTVRDLLSHRSGVQTNDAIFFGSVSRRQIVFKARFLRQTAKLRTRFDYHNIMVLTAGQVAAHVLGTTWDEAVRARILEPLGMTRTCTSINELHRFNNVATPHTFVKGELVKVPWLNVDNTGPAGCINSSAADMAKWIQIQLGSGHIDNRELWGAEEQREMFAPHVDIPARMTGCHADSVDVAHFGLGWMIHEYRGRKLVHHGGATDGMGAFVAMVPGEDLGVVVLSNTIQTPLLARIGYRIIDEYLKVPSAEWPQLAPPDTTKHPALEAQTPAAGRPPSVSLDDLTGVFEHQIFERVTITREGEYLKMSFDIYPSATLTHRDRDRFSMRFDRRISSMWQTVFGDQFEVEFHVDTSPAVRTVSIAPFGEFVRTQ